MSIDPDRLVGHANLRDGQLVTVEVNDDDEVLLALYEIPAEQPTGDAPIQPAPVIAMTAGEAELIGGIVTLAAVTAFGRFGRCVVRTYREAWDAVAAAAMRGRRRCCRGLMAAISGRRTRVHNMPGR